MSNQNRSFPCRGYFANHGVNVEALILKCVPLRRLVAVAVSAQVERDERVLSTKLLGGPSPVPRVRVQAMGGNNHARPAAPPKASESHSISFIRYAKRFKGSGVTAQLDSNVR